MAKSYRCVDRDQAFLLPPSMTDWLPDDHLVWFMIEAVGQIDTSAFHCRARLGGVGREGYDPDMLLTLGVYAMAVGQRSSRQIERLCHTDLAFKVICAGDVPDHTVLARFRQRHEQAMEDLFTEVLVLCAQLGMVRLGVVALDGTKIAANASRYVNRGEEHLRKLVRQHLETAAAADEADDVLFGADRRGDELPDKLGDRSGRGRRISQALEEIGQRRTRQVERTHAVVEAYYQAVAEGTAAGRHPKGADPVVIARLRMEREQRQAQQRNDERAARAEQARRTGARRPGGKPPVPPDQHCRVREARAKYEAAQAAAAQPEQAADDQPGHDSPSESVKVNVTDPQSRLLKTQNGWIQGYNCQTAVSDDGFIITARATQDPNDVRQFQPTMTAVSTAANRLSERTNRDDLTVGTLIADAGYDSADNLKADGPDRLIANATRRDTDKHATEQPASG